MPDSYFRVALETKELDNIREKRWVTLNLNQSLHDFSQKEDEVITKCITLSVYFGLHNKLLHPIRSEEPTKSRK